MLKPNYFYGKSSEVVKYYQEFEDFLLEDIAKFLIKSGEIGGKADRELFILEQMGMNDARIIKKLSELSGKSRNAVRKVLQNSVMTSFSNDKEVLDKYFSGEYGPLNNPVIVDVMDSEWRKTCGELDNLTRTTMGQYNSDVLRLLNEAEIRTAGGAQSYSSAVCDVLDQYATAGMVINYPTGARMTIESAVRCAVVTSMNQTAAQVTNKYIAEGGIEYVVVTAHTGARHSDKGGLYSHDEWQGKVYKIRGSEDGFPNLLEATGYDIDPVTGNGTVVNPHGLHGYNCRHSHQPFDKDMENPWINPDGTPRVDPEESREKYDLQQKQRAMERGIRSTKRQLNMKDVEIKNLPEGPELETAKLDYDKLAYKLRNRNQVYNDFCAENKLTKQADRVKVAGFSQADARKAGGRAVKYGNQKLESGGSKVFLISDSSIKNVKAIGSYPDAEFIKIQHIKILEKAKEHGSVEYAKMFNSQRIQIGEDIAGTSTEIDLNIPGRIHAKYVMHNHPNNSSFSNMDLIWLVKNSQVEVFSIVKNNGVSEVIRTNNMDIKQFVLDYNRAIKKYEQEIAENEERGYNKAIKYFLTKSKAGFIYERQ